MGCPCFQGLFLDFVAGHTAEFFQGPAPHRTLYLKPATKSKNKPRKQGQTNLVTNTGTDTDIDLVQCSVCKRTFKKTGLKQHQTKMGCREHLSDSYRNTSKTETTSIRDSNHSDASGRVRLNTTHRGNGAQKLKALGKVSKRKKLGQLRLGGGKCCCRGKSGIRKNRKKER